MPVERRRPPEAKAEAGDSERLTKQVAELQAKLEGQCETCEGTGIMSVLDHVESPNEKEVYVDAECGECHGTGKGWIADLIKKARPAPAANTDGLRGTLGDKVDILLISAKNVLFWSDRDASDGKRLTFQALDAAVDMVDAALRGTGEGTNE